MSSSSKLNKARCISLTRLSPSQVVTNAPSLSSKTLSVHLGERSSVIPPIKITPRVSSLQYRAYHAQNSLKTMPNTLEIPILESTTNENTVDENINNHLVPPPNTDPPPAPYSSSLAPFAYQKMPPSPPHDDVNLGDVVDVPGMMYGTVRYIGSVKRKKGIFVGVELDQEFSSRGKNNGDVDGICYFTPEIPGSGIFLPLNKATRRIVNAVSESSSVPLSSISSITVSHPTSNVGTNLHTPTKVSGAKSHPTLSSLSPRARPAVGSSMSTTDLPARKTPATTKSSLTSPTPQTPAKYGLITTKNLSQSVRGTRDSGDSTKISKLPARPGIKASLSKRSTSDLSQSMSTHPESVSSHQRTPRNPPLRRLDSSCSLNDKTSGQDHHTELIHFRAKLEERELQLQQQTTSLAEMEKSLAEVQHLMEYNATHKSQTGSMESHDVLHLRELLKEKNEKISMLIAEFDAHRADFRSTIDTLELASTETERVYEQRISELLQEIRDLMDRNESVEDVAKQLKQLEELVQELEEGLEDARRGEVEARGEVEFLRGEVERTRSELRRERERSAGNLTVHPNPDYTTLVKELEKRDEEIRGLKKIIHSLSLDSFPDSIMRDLARISTQSRPMMMMEGNDFARGRFEYEKKRESMEARPYSDTTKTTYSSEEQERDLERLRRESLSAPSATILNQPSMSPGGSRGNMMSHQKRGMHESKSSLTSVTEPLPETDNYSSANESFCELCESLGHDILVCTNVFSSESHRNPPHISILKQAILPHSDDMPAPLASKKSPLIPTPELVSLSLENEPIAGKESKIVDLEKWCAVCEREGHESIDCPFEENL